MGDESVCELLEVGLGMLARARLSESLRNTAQSCVQVIVRAAFRRLKTLTKEDVERLLEGAREAEAEREKREKEREKVGAVAGAGIRTSESERGEAEIGKEVERGSLESGLEEEEDGECDS